jgi:hypothetical protein
MPCNINCTLLVNIKWHEKPEEVHDRVNKRALDLHAMNIPTSCNCDTSEACQWTSFPLTQLPHTCTAGFTAQFKDSTAEINAE